GIAGRDALARGEELFEPPELRDADCAEDVGELVVEARCRPIGEAARPAVVPQPAYVVGQPGVVRRHRPALTGRDDLARVEGEAAEQPEPPAGMVAAARSEGSGRVLDERDRR